MKSILNQTKLIGLFVIVLGVLFVSQDGTALAADKVWTGGGSDNKFSTAANWSPSGAPVAGDNLKLKHSRIEFYPMLLKQQKLIDGELQAVFECGYCGAKFRVDLEEAEKYSAFIESEEIKKRIMAGYK